MKAGREAHLVREAPMRAPLAPQQGRCPAPPLGPRPPTPERAGPAPPGRPRHRLLDEPGRAGPGSGHQGRHRPKPDGEAGHGELGNEELGDGGLGDGGLGDGERPLVAQDRAHGEKGPPDPRCRRSRPPEPTGSTPSSASTTRTRQPSTPDPRPQALDPGPPQPHGTRATADATPGDATPADAAPTRHPRHRENGHVAPLLTSGPL